MNLTGTMPKGLLSPTQNSKKHKHAEYFESAQTVAYNQFENTMPIQFRGGGYDSNGLNDKHISLKGNGGAAISGGGGTVININIENSGCLH